MSAVPSAMNLGRLLSDTARRHPTRIGLVHGERSWTWREIDDRVNALRAGLEALGLGKGDSILLLSHNKPQVFEVLWAVFKLGAVFVPANFRLAPPEIAFIAENCQARAIIYDSGGARGGGGPRAGHHHRPTGSR